MNDQAAFPERYPLYFKYALKTTQQGMDSFIKDPILKTVLSPYWSYIGLPPNKMNFHDRAAMIYGYKPFHLKGGSQALSNAITDTIIRKCLSGNHPDHPLFDSSYIQRFDRFAAN